MIKEIIKVKAIMSIDAEAIIGGASVTEISVTFIL